MQADARRWTVIPWLRRAGIILALPITVSFMGSGAHAVQSASMPPSDAVSVLYSVAAPSALITGKASSPRITLPGSSPTLWFTDRPQRTAGSGTLSAFIKTWKANRFDEVPPNAAVLLTRKGKQTQAIVTLSNPRVNAGNVSFIIRPLSIGEVSLGMSANSMTLPSGEFDRAELFIDDAGSLQCGSYTGSIQPNDQSLVITIFNADGSVATQVLARIAARFPAASGLGDYGFAYSTSSGLTCA